MRKRAEKFIAHAIVITSILALIGFFIVSCVPPQYAYKSIPQSPGRYSFTGFNIPETRPPASVQLTVAVVEPYYKERLHSDYSNVIKSFSSSVGIGLDEILVAKGITTKGPYESLDDIPYPDKKNSNLTLTETVFILPTEKGQVSLVGDYYAGSHGQSIYAEVETRRLLVEVWVAFEMREPLSAEKMWVKKLDLGVFDANYQIAVQKYYQSYASSDPWAPPSGEWKYGDVLFNTKADTLAGILTRIYPKVMQTAWVYLNTEEMQGLDVKVKEIRELKRY